MFDNMDIGTPCHSFDGGASFKGVGDSEVESHFTFVEREGWHASTYLDLGNIVGGGGTGKEPFERFDIGVDSGF